MVKIDIISGFLGAGKTTFANMLLRYYMDSGLRPVYIVNEFGQTGLDADIIKAEGFEAVEFEGGCICCTLKDNVASSITEVIDAFSPTNIVFEPSGIFVFDQFSDLLRQPPLDRLCEVGHVFTVVDSVGFSLAKAAYGSFLYNQIKNAGILLLSKLEKTRGGAEEIICDIKTINPDALVMSKIWSDWAAKEFELLLEQRTRPQLGHHAHHHGRFQAVTVKLDGPLSREAMDGLIAGCQSGAFGDLCRVKGVVATEGHPVLLNIAMQDVSITRFHGASDPALTFIGQAVAEWEIQAFFGLT